MWHNDAKMNYEFTVPIMHLVTYYMKLMFYGVTSIRYLLVQNWETVNVKEIAEVMRFVQTPAVFDCQPGQEIPELFEIEIIETPCVNILKGISSLQVTLFLLHQGLS